MEKTNADHVIERLRNFSLEIPRGTIGQFKEVLKEVLLLEDSILTYKDFLQNKIGEGSD